MPKTLHDLIAAGMLLTRLPLGRLSGGVPDLARASWAFPVIGFAIGAIGGATNCMARRMGLPPLPAAIWGLIVTTLITGALHEDGLADTADGFGGGHTPARRLEIMRDSRIGSYGAIALILAFGLRASAIAALPTPLLIGTMATAGGLCRTGMIGAMAMLPPARSDGLSANIGRIGWLGLIAAATIAVCGAMVLQGWRGIVVACIAAITGFAMSRQALRRIGGQTGDILGCIAVVTECAVLTAMVCGL